MAIYKRSRKSGTRYQVKVIGTDRRWYTETFDRLADAERRESDLKLKKLTGNTVCALNRNLTVSDYFRIWESETRCTGASPGWRVAQIQMFEDYVEPVLGSIKLQKVTPALIAKVLSLTVEKGRGASTQRHVFTLMHKVFGDAVTLFQVLDRNPVLKSLKTKLPQKEAAFLEIGEIKKLLSWVSGKPYEIAVWLGIAAGRRIGEIQALRWEHVDFDRGLIHIRSTYVRREKRFQDYPKGKKWHTIKAPSELMGALRRVKAESKGDFVAASTGGGFLSYHTYQKALARYCSEAKVRMVTSHGLRHSTSELYMANGASRDDLRILFAHSSGSVTDRYVHDKGQRLERVADVILLFPEGGEASVSPEFPQTEKNGEIAQ